MVKLYLDYFAFGRKFCILYSYLLVSDSKISLIGKNKGQILAKILRHLEESGDKKIFTDQVF